MKKSPVQCLECGLLDEDRTGRKQCYALKRNLSKEELRKKCDCYYFLPTINEDGKSLTPFQHYLLKIDQIDRKR